jgi:transglutaminase-like putative cysteine protease
LLVFLHPALAGDPDYAVSNIPAGLKENAHVVKRLEEVTLTIYHPGEVRMIVKYAITVLDAEGEKHAALVEPYNKLFEIRSIKGALYDAEGKQLKKLKQSEIQDMSGVDDESLMTDTRYKRHKFYHNLYPHTVEYEVEIKQNHTFYLRPWVPQEDEEYAVEQSRMIVNVPLDYTLRYRNFLYKGEPVIVTNKDTRSYTWEVKSLAALQDESYTPEWSRRTTTVLLAAANFEMQRYKGTMNTWEEFGNFVYALNQGRDQLPDAIKQTVHQLTDGLSREQKISKLYNYLQQHTRYISVQLGIGGWQTFDAAYVAAKGYGDCKALSNYMCALLKEAGVKACCVLVRAGENSTAIQEDFPSTQFNHMIACAPGEKDTTWLECTSSVLPVGYLSGFTANRAVLITDEKGSKLVRTPSYTVEQNLQLRHIVANVAETGDMLVKANTHYTGLQQDDLQQRLHALTREKLLERLKQGHLMPSYDVNGYECKELKGELPAIDEQMEIAAHNYATVTGKRMFLEPNLLNKHSRRLATGKERISDIYLNYSYRDVDTVAITIPAGYTPESIPQSVAVQSVFGNYSSSIRIEGNLITYIRTIDHKGGLYPAITYPELEKFYNAIYKADRARIVLVKK